MEFNIKSLGNMAHWFHLLISVGIFTSFLQFTLNYSFKNCNESVDSKKAIFKCIKRQAQTVSAIVDDIPPSATNITISYCILSDIPSGSFSHLPELKILRLDCNRIRKINEDAFIHLMHLQTLNLSTNAISYLSHSSFRGLHNLTNLLLDDNQLKSLPLDLFSSLTSLKILDLRRNQLFNFSAVVHSITHLSALTKLKLSFNSLNSLHHSASLPQSLATLYLDNNNLNTLGCSREFLSSVKVLDFSYNKFLSSRAFWGMNLNGLRYLRLHSTNVSIIKLLKCNFTKVPPQCIDFSGLGANKPHFLSSLCKQLSHYPKIHIRNMTLQSNGIRTLNKTMLSNCPKISGILDLSYNELKNIKCLEFLKDQKQVRSLKFEHNHITKLLSCKTATNLSLPNLKELSYRYNRILYISAFAFIHAPKITTLLLNINIIAYMDKKALSGLRDLVTLRLDNNLLSDLYAESFEDLHSLKTLNLRNNRIAVIFNNTFHSLGNLTILDLGGNKIAQLMPQAFNGLDSLANLYLDRNRLEAIDDQQLGRLHRTLQVLDLCGNSICYYTKQPYSPFVNLTKLIDLKLDGQLPYGISILPSAFFRGLTSLTRLYLSNNHISYFNADIFDDLKSLTFLTLDNSGAGVTQLKPGIFKNLQKLVTLSIENMGVESFSEEVFGNLTALKVLHLNRNALQTMDIQLLENLTNLQYLDLRNSPLSCSCLNSDLQNWTKNNQKVQLVYLYDLSCQDLNGSNFYNFETDVCYLDLGVYLFASTYFATIVLILVPLLHVKLYWKFKYGYYVFRSWFGEQWRRLREEEEKSMYDAFISYNSADEKWVMEKLLPNLEGNGSSFKLCLHHRDFEPGRYIVDNIVSAVYNSRKTVCVISQSFLRSEWCSLEIQMASYRLFHEMQDVLLLVFLESIHERQLSTYHRMRKVMLKKTYLQWPQPDCTDPINAQELFWKQLKRAISSSSRCQEEQSEVDLQMGQPTEGNMEERGHFGSQPNLMP
ncbi:toll-like receptor 21 [Electrophorus electricus]|uniref:TIR domain-containing protein n=1 Tax=Electrophorus electricus TaxID=8005 RepID=A0A4W4E6G8_ELEEL|nr:toll-like receptor 21 [Electrophorus electricus]